MNNQLIRSASDRMIGGVCGGPRATMNLTATNAAIDARPAPTPEQYADARRFVTSHAPDLYEAIFGSES